MLRVVVPTVPSSESVQLRRLTREGARFADMAPRGRAKVSGRLVIPKAPAAVLAGPVTRNDTGGSWFLAKPMTPCWLGSFSS